MSALSRYRALALTLLTDAALLTLAFTLAYYVRYELELFRPVLDAFQAPYSFYLPLQWAYVALTILFMALNGEYAARRGGNWLSELYRIANAATTVAVLLITYSFLFQPLLYSRLMLIQAVFITISLLGAWRLGRRLVQANLRRRGLGLARVLVVGAGEVGRAVMRNIMVHPELGYRVVGFVDDDPGKTELGRFKRLGALDDVEDLLAREHVDEVIITLPWMYQRKILALVRACARRHVRARVVPDMFQLALNQLDVDDIGGLPLIGVKEPGTPGLARVVKRLLDVAGAMLVLGVLGVPMLIVAALIKLDSPGPALFTQTRVGKNGQTFLIYKFRSMYVDAEARLAELKARNEASGPLFKIKDDPRITGVGRWLRRLSIDELPQIINVLRGEMSLVGPRPGLPHEVAQYQPWQRERLSVTPGMTGLWQVSGRSELTFDEMCLLDIYYIENWSLGLDVQILLRTPARVLFGSGAY